jgi:threonine dehydrogenase-like Zn-dependent dehydrogenase
MSRIAWLTKDHTVEIRDQPPAPLGRHQIRIAVTQIGVCGSERELMAEKNDAALPTALGHEAAGEVMEVGRGVSRFKPFDVVATWVGAAMADELVVDAIDCVGVYRRVEAPASAEPLKCVLNALGRTRPRGQDRQVIVGAGFMALLGVMVLRHQGMSVTVIGRRDEPLAVARDLGAETLKLDVRTDRDVERAAREIDAADVVYEATGDALQHELAALITKPDQGKLVWLGYYQGEMGVRLGSVNARGLNVVNGHRPAPNAHRSGMLRAAELLNSGFNPARLYTHTFPLTEGGVFEALTTRPQGFIKGLIRP